jgi:hypothetical protein
MSYNRHHSLRKGNKKSGAKQALSVFARLKLRFRRLDRLPPLAEAHRMTKQKTLLGGMTALQAYARQAKGSEMILGCELP